ncbi:hypothetical protein TWF788_002649 [Orbilia oligospora]|uniref:Uncharacterized protein n=1 Tax=Orbilia oligospora TaxID=2813651 RepID=A0A7C8Q0E9_ORBOL|nr:hypothetical protein TWF788_002649 [Orbilia oligospora]
MEVASWLLIKIYDYRVKSLYRSPFEMEDISDSERPSQSMLTVPASPIPSGMPGKGPKLEPSTPRGLKRKTSPPISSRPSKIATPGPSKIPETLTVRGLYKYHGLGRKKLEKYHSPGSLRRYAEAELQKLQSVFDEEIAKIKSSDIPLAQEITFSNIDELVEEVMGRLETEKQTLTHLRGVIMSCSRTIFQIAEDLLEEIGYVTASQQEEEDDEEEKEERDVKDEEMDEDEEGKEEDEDEDEDEYEDEDDIILVD